MPTLGPKVYEKAIWRPRVISPNKAVEPFRVVVGGVLAKDRQHFWERLAWNHGIRRYPVLHHPHPKKGLDKPLQAKLSCIWGLVWDGRGIEAGI